MILVSGGTAFVFSFFFFSLGSVKEAKDRGLFAGFFLFSLFVLVRIRQQKRKNEKNENKTKCVCGFA